MATSIGPCLLAKVEQYSFDEETFDMFLVRHSTHTKRLSSQSVRIIVDGLVRELIEATESCFGFGDDIFSGIRPEQVVDDRWVGGQHSLGGGVPFFRHPQPSRQGGPCRLPNVLRKDPNRGPLLKPFGITRLVDGLQESDRRDGVMRV